MSRIVIFAFLSLILWPAAEGMNMAHAEDAHRGEYPGDVKVELHDKVAQRVLTIRIGPIDLPAHAHHMLLPDLFVTIPFDGWFIAFQPRLVDDGDTSLPGRLLHHLAFFNTARRGFICDTLEEPTYAVGSELLPWPAPHGGGYPIEKGSRIRISTMLHNPTETPMLGIYLVVRTRYKLITDQRALKNAYPVWFHVGNCPPQGDVASLMFDLNPGKSVVTQQWIVDYPGKLIGVGGHIHDYGRQLHLENVTQKEPIATIYPKLDRKGRIVSIPNLSLAKRGGYQLNRGDIVKVTALYDNPTGERLPMGGMAIVVGAFVPDNDEEFAAAMRIR